MRAHCSNCKDDRNCEILAKVEQRGGDEDFQWHIDWYIFKCRGCDHVFAQTVSSNSEDYDNYYEQDGSTGTKYNELISYWPPVTKRPHPDWLFEYTLLQNRNGIGLGSVLEQVYGALNNDLPVLAAIGMRTSFDIAAVQLGVDPAKPFEKKIVELIEKGKIRELDRPMISSLVDAGSASAHRGWTPNQKQLELMIELLENFIEENFIVPERKRQLGIKSKELLDEIPPRQKSNP
jgi:Domain of unknown function (DUF4145)